jgi:TetR/AcrR family transcriptional regulator
LVKAAAAPPARSRARLLAAASAEFAARGFAGAGVDRIARAARLNKAMIYYHFKSKQALYRAVIGDMFGAVAARLGTVAQAPDPGHRVDGLLRVLMEEAGSHPHFAPIMMRELAEGGRHLDRATLAAIRGVFEFLRLAIVDGQRRGRFGPVNPLLVHFTLVGPLLFYQANAPIRAEMQRLHLVDTRGATPEAFLAHLQEVARRMLRKDER